MAYQLNYLDQVRGVKKLFYNACFICINILALVF